MSNRKDKQRDKAKALHQKKLQRVELPTEPQPIPSGHSAFRLLAWQPLSITLEHPRPFDLYLQQINCRLALRPAEQEGPGQRTRGGSFIGIEFCLPADTDLLVAAHKGLDIIEDFLSAVALIEGATLGNIEPIQIVRAEKGSPLCSNTFIQFLQLSQNHWDQPISQTTINHVRHLVAHWDGLDTGSRLRRAARQFRHAVGTPDEITAFQHAYIGLEAMEKPLADALKIPPGVEEVKGKCAKCGEMYIRRRTVLAGVRAYVYGNVHPETTSNKRKKEWKEMNGLRQDLFHGLADLMAVSHRARAILPAAMHYLRDAICCQSHAHSLESPKFRLARTTGRLVLMGTFTSTTLGPLDTWIPMLEIKEAKWVKHDRHGLVPEVRFYNPGIPDLRVAFFWLDVPLSAASEADLHKANFETN